MNEPIAEHLFAAGAHGCGVEGGGTPKMGLVGGKHSRVFLGAVPAKFGGLFGQKTQEGKRFYAIQVILFKKGVGWVGFQKIEQHQSPAAAIGGLVGVFFKGAVEQAGRFPPGACGDPGAAGFGVAGKKEGMAGCLLPRQPFW